MAHLGFDRFIVNDSGANVSVVGIGGVVVRPEFQRKGIPALLFRKLHEDCPENVRSETFTLFCPERLVAYYRRHGYEKVERSVEIVQFGKPVTTTFTLMTRGSGIQRKGERITFLGHHGRRVSKQSLQPMSLHARENTRCRTRPSHLIRSSPPRRFRVFEARLKRHPPDQTSSSSNPS